MLEPITGGWVDSMPPAVMGRATPVEPSIVGALEHAEEAGASPTVRPGLGEDSLSRWRTFVAITEKERPERML